MAYAVRPSSEIVFAVNGSATAATCGTAASAATAASTAAFCCVAVSVVPAGAVKTTLAVVPSEPLPNFSDSTSMARCDSVPGMANAPVVGPDRVAAPRPVRARTTNQTASVRRRRR